MSKNIEFISHYDVPDDIKPVPAKKAIPDWYKDTPPFFNNKKMVISDDGVTDRTIKKCIPILDSISSGYIIKTYCDLEISNNDGIPYYRWAMSFDDEEVTINFHHPKQADKYPNKYINGENPIPKFKNLFAIVTPKGYSCLYIPPMHRENIISIIPGLVDTDVYNLPVEFPFVLTDPNFTGVIPRGTPIAQIIPIKRESWKSSFSVQNLIPGHQKLRSMFYDSYKNMWWVKKSYE